MTRDPRNGANSGDMAVEFDANIGAIQLASICIDLHSNRPPRGRGGPGKKRNKLRGCRSLGLMPQGVAAISRKYQRGDLNSHAR